MSTGVPSAEQWEPWDLAKVAMAEELKTGGGVPWDEGRAALLGYQVVATGTLDGHSEAVSAHETDADWKGDVHGVEHVSLEMDTDSDEERRIEDKAFMLRQPLEKQLEHGEAPSTALPVDD